MESLHADENRSRGFGGRRPAARRSRKGAADSLFSAIIPSRRKRGQTNLWAHVDRPDRRANRPRIDERRAGDLDVLS